MNALFSTQPQPSSRSAQRGVVLVVALVLLAIMALVGVNAMRSVSQEERMAAHTYDRNLSFQAAESALREAEAVVAANKPMPTSCANGLCPAAAPTDTPRWLVPNSTDWQAATTITSGSIAITPQYIVEYLGNTFECEPGSPSTSTDCKRYRITARSNPGADRSVVMLQSTFATD
ncbi:pilus assembly PilX family protein [Hydrogenophaga intermedia]|jgi:type IV pilus assembly protein PilX|uniref:pilus assembly PilX family protein n=1 Tax=Hydrogenophaga intermedia TaxID=65786 RepID=UPI002042DE01|nr:PilX N-terminal domain-containing pilus assembly protein [Hydrogenophaga intermedia]MCM3562064.1 PilX N-terminal domain-containing pilus assembly protein [Hydrogenophaga intermedia]